MAFHIITAVLYTYHHNGFPYLYIIHNRGYQFLCEAAILILLVNWKIFLNCKDYNTHICIPNTKLIY